MYWKITAYFTLITAFFVFMFMISWFQREEYPVNVLEATVRPDNFLLNSKLYIAEKLTERSRRNLIDAIRTINQIKSEADPMSQAHLETGLRELNLVLNDMNSGRFSKKDLNDASIIALNAMTYFQIKSAEHFILTGRFHQAREALGYGMLHVKNALTHAEGSKKETEIEIYSEMNTIVEDEELSKDEIIAKLDRMLEELEDLEIAYH